MSSKLKYMIINKDRPIREALLLMNKNDDGIVFVVDENDKICGVATDGDMRRAFLKNITPADKVSAVMNSSFVAVAEGASGKDIIEKMRNNNLHQCMPVVDKTGVIVDYYSIDFNMKIPIAQPCIKGNELKYLTQCIATNWISSQGEFVQRFQDEFAKYLGVKYAVATSNGTTALHLACAALGITSGDEVIVPTLTFIATANAVTYTGAQVVFADSETATWNIDPRDIESRITSRTKAIIPVHLYGQPAMMDEIMDIASRHNLYVIEDAAEAHGAEYKGKKVGGIGHVGMFSFFGNKIITTGEGGMLVTNDEDVYNHALVLRDHGMDTKKKYWHNHIGFNYRLTNLQSAIGCAQLERIEEILDEKIKIMHTYDSCFSGMNEILTTPRNDWSKNVCWMYSIIVDEKTTGISRDHMMNRLIQEKIECRTFFYPIHWMPPYKRDIEMKNAEYLSARGINLPSYVGLQQEDIFRIAEVVRRVLKEG
jgi:perosamine synthetase